MNFFFWVNIAILIIMPSIVLTMHHSKTSRVTKLVAWVSKGTPVILVDYERKPIYSVAWKIEDTGVMYSYYSYWHKIGKVYLLEDGTVDKDMSDAIFIDNWYEN